MIIELLEVRIHQSLKIDEPFKFLVDSCAKIGSQKTQRTDTSRWHCSPSLWKPFCDLWQLGFCDSPDSEIYVKGEKNKNNKKKTLIRSPVIFSLWPLQVIFDVYSSGEAEGKQGFPCPGYMFCSSASPDPGCSPHILNIPPDSLMCFASQSSQSLFYSFCFWAHFLTHLLFLICLYTALSTVSLFGSGGC